VNWCGPLTGLPELPPLPPKFANIPGTAELCDLVAEGSFFLLSEKKWK
jgi:hypothetical protein